MKGISMYDEDVAVIVVSSIKGMADSRLDFQVKPSSPASSLVNILFDHGWIGRENDDSLQIRVHNTIFYPSERQTSGSLCGQE